MPYVWELAITSGSTRFFSSSYNNIKMGPKANSDKLRIKIENVNTMTEDTVNMEKIVTINMLKKFAMIKLVQKIIVKKTS